MLVVKIILCKVIVMGIKGLAMVLGSNLDLVMGKL